MNLPENTKSILLICGCAFAALYCIYLFLCCAYYNYRRKHKITAFYEVTFEDKSVCYVKTYLPVDIEIYFRKQKKYPKKIRHIHRVKGEDVIAIEHWDSKESEKVL